MEEEIEYIKNAARKNANERLKLINHLKDIIQNDDNLIKKLEKIDYDFLIRITNYHYTVTTHSIAKALEKLELEEK